MSKALILLVEDEPAIRQMVILGLRSTYNFLEAGTLYEAQALIQRHEPRLILLDWMLPDGSGTTLLEAVRQRGQQLYLPVIMLTARGSEEDIIKGLDKGADDYIRKPFSLPELASRIQAVLRRSPKQEEMTMLSWNDVHMNLSEVKVFYGTKPVRLHRREFTLLQRFLEQPGKVHSRENLLDYAWGDEVEVNDRAVDVAIRRLRKAFEDVGGYLPITTIRGIGYRLEK